MLVHWSKEALAANTQTSCSLRGGCRVSSTQVHRSQLAMPGQLLPANPGAASVPRGDKTGDGWADRKRCQSPAGPFFFSKYEQCEWWWCPQQGLHLKIGFREGVVILSHNISAVPTSFSLPGVDSLPQAGTGDPMTSQLCPALVAPALAWLGTTGDTGLIGAFAAPDHLWRSISRPGTGQEAAPCHNVRQPGRLCLSAPHLPTGCWKLQNQSLFKGLGSSTHSRQPPLMPFFSCLTQ